MSHLSIGILNHLKKVGSALTPVFLLAELSLPIPASSESIQHPDVSTIANSGTRWNSDPIPDSVFSNPAGVEPYVEYTGPKPDNTTYDSASALPPYFDADALKRNGILTVDQWVGFIPEVFKKRFFMLKNSASTHTVDKEGLHPRVIMHDFDQYGRTVENHPMDMMALGTNPADPQHNVVERIHWNPATYKFEFYAMEFGPNGPKALPTESCKECHTKHLRPNWDPAHNWPNAYGSKERFDPTEEAMVRKVMGHDVNPILADHFKVEDQLRPNSQTPGTVMFYGLFGPTHHYVSNQFVTHPNYKENKFHLVKVLAGCQSDIESIKQKYPKLFAQTRKTIVDAAPRFKFKEPYNPVMDPELSDRLAALMALFKTKDDDMGWLGKTRKMVQMYSHAFFKQDFEMLLGGLCEHDPEIKNLLLHNGADTANPCYKRNTAALKVCAEPEKYELAGEAGETPGAASVASSVQPCLAPVGYRGRLVQTFCVRVESDSGLKTIRWDEASQEFFYCDREDSSGSCLGTASALGRAARQSLVSHYAALAKTGRFRDRTQQSIALRTLGQTAPAVTAGRRNTGRYVLAGPIARGPRYATASAPTARAEAPSDFKDGETAVKFEGETAVVNCVAPLSAAPDSKTGAFCVSLKDGGTKRIRWDETQGFYFCQKSKQGACTGTKYALDLHAEGELAQRAVAMEKNFRGRYGAKLGTFRSAEQRTMAAHATLDFAGTTLASAAHSGAATLSPRPARSRERTRPKAVLASATRTRPAPSNPSTRIAQSEVASESAKEQILKRVAGQLESKCLSCHNARKTKGSFLIASGGPLDAAALTGLETKPLALGAALDRMIERVKTMEMPPEKDQVDSALLADLEKWKSLAK